MTVCIVKSVPLSLFNSVECALFLRMQEPMTSHGSLRDEKGNYFDMKIIVIYVFKVFS